MRTFHKAGIHASCYGDRGKHIVDRDPAHPWRTGRVYCGSQKPLAAFNQRLRRLREAGPFVDRMISLVAEGKTLGDAAHIVLLDIRGTAQTAAALGALATSASGVCPDGCASPCPRRLLEPLRNRLARLIDNFLVGMENPSFSSEKGAKDRRKPPEVQVIFQKNQDSSLRRISVFCRHFPLIHRISMNEGQLPLLSHHFGDNR